MNWIRIYTRTSIMPRLEKKYINQTIRGQGRNFSRVCGQKEWTRGGGTWQMTQKPLIM